ncbi:hypothetical protein Golax_005667 [Gossypium laxum]|uniref:Uncharacterized protein n=1 Tax=Gossypium laxum TaxID=34288 RepID=A0A7J9A1F3_9ROSI|nr:hypothetical protein [Gossypium laxum]
MENTSSSMSCISMFRDKKKAPDGGNDVPLQKRRARSPSMSIFKVAIRLLRTKPVAEMVPDSKPVQVDVDSKVEWKGIVVESVHPMHLQSTPLSPSHSPSMKVTTPKIMLEPKYMPNREEKEEVILSPLSPIAFPISSFNDVSSSDSSPYDSPCEGSDKEKCDEHHDDDGDEEIDAKAEEFITQFYEQMRLQTLNS